jgi:hypothetical protein
VAARELAHTGNTTIAIAMCSGDSLDENGKFPGKKANFSNGKIHRRCPLKRCRSSGYLTFWSIYKYKALFLSTGK